MSISEEFEAAAHQLCDRILKNSHILMEIVSTLQEEGKVKMRVKARVEV